MSSRHFEADRVEDIALMNTIRRLLVSTRTITVNAGGGGGGGHGITSRSVALTLKVT